MGSWKPIRTFKKDRGAIPNELILLLVRQKPWHEGETGADRRPLTDVKVSDPYVTMGAWWPADKGSGGEWIGVGWNWCNDYLCEDHHIMPIAWQKLPSTKYKKA